MLIRELTHAEKEILECLENYPYCPIAVAELKEEDGIWELNLTGQKLSSILIGLEKLGLVKRRKAKYTNASMWFLPGEEPAALGERQLTNEESDQITKRVYAITGGDLVGRMAMIEYCRSYNATREST
jgi:hypothetical protein